MILPFKLAPSSVPPATGTILLEPAGPNCPTSVGLPNCKCKSNTWSSFGAAGLLESPSSRPVHRHAAKKIRCTVAWFVADFMVVSPYSFFSLWFGRLEADQLQDLGPAIEFRIAGRKLVDTEQVCQNIRD